MQEDRQERNKELARKRREHNSANKEKGVKAGLGVITYNLRENTISIPHTIETPHFKKKDTRNTFIGIDRGVKNSIVLAAVYIDTTKLNGIRVYQEIFNEPIISQQVFRSLHGLGARIVGVKVFKSSFINEQKKHILAIAKKRQKKRKEVGNRYHNTSNTISHQISAEAVKFISQFRNPVVFFEDLNMDKKKRRHKHGRKNKKNTRRMLSKWDYGSIRRKIEYKLERYGIWTMGINPMFTSQTCSHCGAMGIRDGIGFKCKRCGLGIGSNPISTIGQYNADVNASVNIALKGLFALYGQKVGVVADPNERPEENVQKPVPIPELTGLMAMTGIEGIKTRRSETVAACPDVSGSVETKTNVSRSTLCGSVQPMVEDHQVGSAPENGFSSFYKGKNNSEGRTDVSSKTKSGRMLSQSNISQM